MRIRGSEGGGSCTGCAGRLEPTHHIWAYQGVAHGEGDRGVWR
jgi:hypothetical protein